jgi:hypothetical protein
MNPHFSEEIADIIENEDEWLPFNDEFAETRSQDLTRVELFLDCCLHGENSLFRIFNHISALDIIELKKVWEVVIELVVCGCGFHEFDKSKQRALVVAISSDIASIFAKQEHDLKIDVSWPNFDLQVLNISERPSTNLPMCSVTLVMVADNRDHAENIVSALNELLFECDEGPVRKWPSLIERIQAEILGLDGSDWDRSEIPFNVSVEVAPIVREARNDFLEFSSNEYPFRPSCRKVDRLLILGGRDPHRTDFSKWLKGWPRISAQSLQRETSKMHAFTILVSSYSPIEYR